MLQKLMNNKILKSFLKFVLLTALIHIGVLVFRTIKEGNVKLLNYFSILDLNAIFPKIVKGWWSDVISAGLMVSIFLVILIFSQTKNRIGNVQ